MSGSALFLTKKVDDLFLVVALKERLNTPPNLTRPAKTVLKLTPALAGGALRVLGGALTHFPCKLRLKKFFTALGVQVHPLHPLATPMAETHSGSLCVFSKSAVHENTHRCGENN